MRSTTTAKVPGKTIRPILVMEVVSGIGDGVFWVGFIALLLDRGEGALGLAMAALARLGPRALISAPAGVLADRVDRRKLLVGLDLVRAISMLGLAAAAAADASSAVLFVIVFASYTVAAPYRPALTAATPWLTGEGGLSSANALIATVRQVMTFVGPVVGAVVLEVWSSSAAFAIDALSFVVSAALLAPIAGLAGRAAHRNLHLTVHRERWLHEVRAGWREVTATRGLVSITVLVFAMHAARGAETVLLVLVAERLGFGPGGIGILCGAIGLGAVCALPAVSRFAETGRLAVVIALSLATTAVPFAALGVLRSRPVVCIVLWVMGAGIVMFEVVSVMLLQRLTRRQMLGRVFGLVGTFSNAGKLLGALAAPALVAISGLRGALWSVAVTIAVLAIATAPALGAMSRIIRTRGVVLRPTVELLASLGIFEGASRAALERVAAEVVPENLAAGSVVVREGDPPDDLFVVREGSFTVSDERHGVLNTLRPPDWFGEIGLLQQRNRTATVTAAGEAVVWRIPGQVFLEALQETANEPSALIDVMADRLALLYEPETDAVVVG